MEVRLYPHFAGKWKEQAKLNQLYFTSCRQHRSLNGQSGFQIRAASPGFQPARLRAATAYVGYKLPDAFPLTADTVSKAPVRFALLDTPELGRILLQSVYVGQEGQGTRGGNFFTHLITDLSAGCDTINMIGLWRSHFWRVADGDDIERGLPEPEFPPPSFPAEFASQAFVSNPRRREMLQYLLDAILMTAHSGKRIFIAAPSHEIAACLYLVALAMPAALTNKLTFSTYEYAPPTASAMIVGADPDSDLPATCYSGTSIGFHSVTGRKSELGGTSACAKYILDQMVKGREDTISKFAKWLNQHDATTPESIECGFYIAVKQSANLSAEQVTLVLKLPKLAIKLLFVDDVVAKLSPDQIGLALDQTTVGESLFAHPTAVERIVLLAKENADFHRSVVHKVARMLNESQTDYTKQSTLSEQVRSYLRGWKVMCNMETSASLEHENLNYIGEVLAKVPVGARKEHMQAIVKSLAAALNTANRLDLIPMIEKILVNIMPRSPQDVYSELCEYFIERATKSYRPAQVVALVAVGLGQCDSSLTRLLGNSGVDHATSLVRALKSAKRRPMLNALQNAAKSWKSKPKAALRRLLPPPFMKRIIASKWFWTMLILFLFGGIAAVIYYKGENIWKYINNVLTTSPSSTT